MCLGIHEFGNYTHGYLFLLFMNFCLVTGLFDWDNAGMQIFVVSQNARSFILAGYRNRKYDTDSSQVSTVKQLVIFFIFLEIYFLADRLSFSFPTFSLKRISQFFTRVCFTSLYLYHVTLLYKQQPYFCGTAN